MPDLAITAALALDESFRNRIMAALVFMARQVVASPTSSTSGQEFSRSYAIAIIRNPVAYTPSAAWVISTDPTISAQTTVDAVTDAMISAAVQATWPALAGMAV